MYDEGVVEAKCRIPECRGNGIPRQIAMSFRRSIVIESTVDLEDQPPGDHEVHASDSGDGHLALESESEPRKSQSQQ